MNEKWKWFWVGSSGLVAGVLITFLAFYFSPRLQEKVARPSRASRQMQAWDDFSQTQKQMLEHFDRLFKEDFAAVGGENIFDLQGAGSSAVGELVQREDDKFIYYDLEVEDIKSTALQSKVENGYLTVSGVVDKKSVDEGVQKSYKSEFHRSFPLPQNIDSKKMEVVYEANRVTFKFPKVG